MTDNILDKLSDDDRYSFQSRRYGVNFLWIGMLPSGRILLGDHARDPIALIETFEELRNALAPFEERAARRARKLEEGVSKQHREEDDLSDIEIDL